MLSLKVSCSDLKTRLFQMKSENWGGVTALAGDAVLYFSGDMPGFVSMASSAAADYVLWRYGEESWGFSLGSAFIAVGDGFFSHAAAAQNNVALQFLLMGMSITWAVGALRYPIERGSPKESGTAPLV